MAIRKCSHQQERLLPLHLYGHVHPGPLSVLLSVLHQLPKHTELQHYIGMQSPSLPTLRVAVLSKQASYALLSIEDVHSFCPLELR